MKKTVAYLVCGVLFSAPAWADINVGVSLSTTGPAASLGVSEKNTVEFLPTEIGGEKINYIVLDDATDTTAAARNARKFIKEPLYLLLLRLHPLLWRLKHRRSR